METLWQDVKYGARMLLKNRGVTLIAIVTLALGIGANTAIFSAVNGILLKPLPYPDPEKIVALNTTFAARRAAPDVFSPANYLDVAAQSQSFEAAGAYMYNSLAYTTGDEPVSLTTGRVTASFFQVLGVKPALGRNFLKEEEVPGANTVVLLSYDTWKSLFAADRAVVGRAILLDGEKYTVVGVMPEGFAFPPAAQVLAPFAFSEQLKQARGAIFINVLARLNSGVTLDAARGEMAAMGKRLAAEFPANAGMGMIVTPLHEQTVGDARTPLLVIAAAVGFVLLVVCANLGNLLLSTAVARQREVTIRCALGASRMRLVRQLLTESIVLAVIGGTLGWLVALWAQPTLVAMASAGAQTSVPRLEEVHLDATVFAFACALSVIAGILFGLAPALSSSRGDLQEALKESGRGAGQSGSKRRLSAALVVAEVALVLVLLVGAGLMLNSFSRLRQVNPGFEAGRSLTMQLILPRGRYAQDPQRLEFARNLLERVRAVPGVEVAGIASPAPIAAIPIVYDTAFQLAGRPATRPEEQPTAYETTVTPGYFRAMGIPFLAGREFSEADGAESQRVAIISRALAEKYFSGENPIGRRIVTGSRQPIEWEIVGIVGDVKHLTLAAQQRPELYMSFYQRTRNTLNLVVRAEREPRELLAAVKAQLWAVDKNLPINNLDTLEAIVARSLSQERLQTVLLGSFAALALVLAAVGIYGVLSYAVSQRTQELGIRAALGATRSSLLGLVLMQGARLAGIGLALGLLASLALTRFMQDLLFGVSPYDGITFGCVSALLMLVALLACWIPARRATRIDPMVAVRYE